MIFSATITRAELETGSSLAAPCMREITMIWSRFVGVKSLLGSRQDSAWMNQKVGSLVV